MLDFIQVSNLKELKEFLTTLESIETNNRTGHILGIFRTFSGGSFSFQSGDYIAKFGEYDFKPVTLNQVRQAFRHKGKIGVKGYKLEKSNIDVVLEFVQSHFAGTFTNVTKTYKDKELSQVEISFGGYLIKECDYVFLQDNKLCVTYEKDFHDRYYLQ